MRSALRKRYSSAVVMLSMALCSAAAVNAQEESPDQIGIMNVNGSVRDLASTVAGVIDRDVAISTDAATGTIIVRGAADDVRATQALLQRIDRRPQVISLNVTLAVSDTQTGKSKIVDEFKLVTLENLEAKSLFGQEVAVPSSRTVSGRSLTQYTMQSVGTLVRATPQLQNDVIAVSLEVEKSWLDPVAAVDEQTPARPMVFNAEVSTTLMITPGEPQSVRALVGGETDTGRVLVVTVTGMPGTEADARRRAARPAPTQVRERRVAPGDDAVDAMRERTRSQQSTERNERGRDRDREDGGDQSLRADRQSRVQGDAGDQRRTDPFRGQRDAARSSSGRDRQQDIDRQAVMAIFARLDANGDESLDASEIGRMPRTLRDEYSDREGDLSRDEFIESFLKILARRREKS